MTLLRIKTLSLLFELGKLKIQPPKKSYFLEKCLILCIFAKKEQ